MRKSLLFFIVFVSFYSLITADAFSLVLNPGVAKCFGEQVTVGLRVQGNITSEDLMEESYHSHLQVFDDNGNELISMQEKSNYFFDITMKKDGTFQVCLSQTGDKEGVYAVDIKMGNQIVDKDQEILSKDEMKEVERVTKRWLKMLDVIQMNLSFLVKKSEDIIETADQISFLLKLFSFMSAIIFPLVAFLQTRFMKSFFKKKKLI